MEPNVMEVMSNKLSLHGLNVVPDEMGYVDFIANKSKSNYINLGGVNSDQSIDSIHEFMCYYHIWDRNDKVIKARKKATFVPDKKSYHDISFVLQFYNMCRLARDTVRNTTKNNNKSVSFKEPELSESLHSEPSDSSTLSQIALVAPEEEDSVDISSLTSSESGAGVEEDSSKDKITLSGYSDNISNPPRSSGSENSELSGISSVSHSGSGSDSDDESSSEQLLPVRTKKNTKKPAAHKAPTKKTTTKKAPAKKTPAKKTQTKTTTTKKAPTKKTPTKKAPANKAPAKKKATTKKTGKKGKK